MMDSELHQWLTNGPGWIRFAVDKQLMDADPDPQAAVDDSEIQGLYDKLCRTESGFEGILNGTASYSREAFWYISLLSEIGFTAQDLGLQQPFNQILNLETDVHDFLLSKEMKPAYYCISSILLSSMARMSGEVSNRLHPHLIKILGLQRLDGGWHCAKRRAVGAKYETSESCPMDNLNNLKLFGEYESYRNDPNLNGALDLLLCHWERRGEGWRPYGFGIGTDFVKLRYPDIKYGILRVLDVLSLFPYAIRSKSFNNMLGYVETKSVGGRYIPESVSLQFSKFDFGQKKEPSRWITFYIERIKKRRDTVLNGDSS